MLLESVLNVTCSKANNKESLPVDCNLLDELLSNKYQQQQSEVRAESDPDKQHELKLKMPALWPSCHCVGGTTSKHIANHTGLIVVDIDAKDNQHLTNFYELKKEICKIPNVAYCGFSVRGKGYFLIMPIAYPDKHKAHYEFIVEYFKKRDLNVDPVCKNINRLRFVSYDPEAYYNHAAKPLQTYYKPQKPKAAQRYQKGNNGPKLAGNVFDNATAWVTNAKSVFFETGQRHEYIFLLCSYLVSKSVKRADAEKWIDSNLMPLSEITTNCIDYPYTNFTPGKEIEVRQAPVKRPAPAQVVSKTPAEPLGPTTPPEPSEPTAYTLQQLQAMAMKHLNNTMLRDKQAGKANYMKAWSQGMEPVINAAGFTQQDFLNSINQ